MGCRILVSRAAWPSLQPAISPIPFAAPPFELPANNPASYTGYAFTGADIPI